MQVMSENMAMYEKSIWLMVGVVFLIVFGVVFAVLNHAREKPGSPQELVATAFRIPKMPTSSNFSGSGLGNLQNQTPFLPQELQLWHPIYVCPVHGAVAAPIMDSHGKMICSLCGRYMMLRNVDEKTFTTMHLF